MTIARLNKIRSVISQRQQGIIVLEDVHDPHNALAVIRSTEAFGFQKVFFIFDQEAPFNPKILGKSTSASANKLLFPTTPSMLSNLYYRS